MDARDVIYNSIQVQFDPKYNPFVEALMLDGVEIPFVMDTGNNGSNMQKYAGRGNSYSSLKIWIRSSDIRGKELTRRHQFILRDRVYYLGAAGVDKDDGMTIRLSLSLDPTEGEDNIFDSGSSGTGGW